MKSMIITLALLSITGCVSLKAPDKPLEINLNVKIDHQISVKVDKELSDVMKKHDDIF